MNKKYGGGGFKIQIKWILSTGTIEHISKLDNKSIFLELKILLTNVITCDKIFTLHYKPSLLIELQWVDRIYLSTS